MASEFQNPECDGIAPKGLGFVAPIGLGLERRLHRSVVLASVGSAVGTLTLLLLASFITTDGPSLWTFLVATITLSIAHILRAAAVLQRTYGLRRPTARGIAVVLMALVAEALAIGVLVGALGDEDVVVGSSFSYIIGGSSLLHLSGSRVLHWSSVPREAAHRQLKSSFVASLCRSIRWAAFCILAAACIDSPSFLWSSLVARITGAILYFLAAEFHAAALVSCTSLSGLCVFASDLLTPSEMVAALQQPLSVHGPGLGRWVASTALAQAVAHRQHSSIPGMYAGTGLSIGADACEASSSLPLFAAEMFSSGGVSWFGPNKPPFSQDSLSSDAPYNMLGRGMSTLEPLATTARPDLGIFAIYLASGLEVIREFTVRVECLVASTSAARFGIVDGLHAAHQVALDSQVVELEPLVRVVVSGLCGWICLSRDLDGAGVVQRAGSLQRVLIELCGLLVALDGVRLLRSQRQISATCDDATKCVLDEVSHAMDQLVMAFEDAGLRQAKLPEAYQQLIENRVRS